MFQAWFQGNFTPFRAAPTVAKYLAVGGVGVILSSDDGSTWTSRVSGFGTSAIYSLAYGNGIYVAVGQNGKISTSVDGITWTLAQLGATTVNFMAVEFFAGAFYVVSTSTLYYTSTNGINWTSHTQPNGSLTAQGSGNNGKVAMFAGSSNQQGAIVMPALPGTPTVVEMGFGSSYYGQWACYYANGLWFGGGQAFKISTAAANATTGLPGGWTLRKGQDSNTNSAVRDFVYDPYRLKYVAVGGNAPQGTSGPGLISLSDTGTSWPVATSLSSQLGSTNFITSAAVSQEAGYIGTANGVWKTTNWTTFTKVATSGSINHVYIRPDM